MPPGGESLAGASAPEAGNEGARRGGGGKGKEKAASGGGGGGGDGYVVVYRCGIWLFVKGNKC